MWLLVGLGNPEARYTGTRHNVGFTVIDALADKVGATLSEKKFKARLCRANVAGQDSVLIEPQTYMNLSGESVGPAAGFYKIPPEQIVVVHDELDLELGKNRLKKGGGHGGHNGLRSLIAHLPSPEFIRLRIGIGRPPSGRDPADYVLSRFAADERELVETSVRSAVEGLESLLQQGLARAMNQFNRDTKEGSASSRSKAEPDKDRAGERSPRPSLSLPSREKD